MYVLKYRDPFGDNVRDASRAPFSSTNGPMGIGPFSYIITPTALHRAVISLEMELGPKGRIRCCNSLLR
jgi:hypothetical protein